MEAVAAWADTIADALDAEPCAGRSSMAGRSV